MKFVGKKTSSGPIVRDVTRNTAHARKIGGGKKVTSLKTTLACGYGRSAGNGNDRAGAQAREILRQMAPTSAPHKRTAAGHE